MKISNVCVKLDVEGFHFDVLWQILRTLGVPKAIIKTQRRAAERAAWKYFGINELEAYKEKP